jgi:hypothetical protein
MTEREWLNCTDPDAMLTFLGRRASDRQRRLHVLAWCRWNCHWLAGWPMGDAATDNACRQAIAIAERLIEGRATETERAAAYQTTSDMAAGWGSWDLGLYYDAALAAAAVAPQPGHIPDPPYYRSAWTDRKLAAEHAAQAALLREIIGNPFRPPVIDPAWRTWNGGIVVKLARRIDAEGAFDLLPILGDALEEAGCVNAELFGHCRMAVSRCVAAEPGNLARLGSLTRALLKGWWLRVPPLGRYESHVRGCWVVDAVLGEPYLGDSIP